jgi:hypothetical protein
VASVQFSRTVERRIRRPLLGMCGRALCATAPPPADAGLSKLNSMLASLRTCLAWPPSSQESPLCSSIQPGSVDMLGPNAQSPTGSHDSRGATDLTAVALGAPLVLPRKEVIQPQLPLRLPCYDFTPVTSPTFDGFLPCGLDHRLRVLLTPVV